MGLEGWVLIGATIASVIAWRRFVLRRWQKRGLSTDRAAALWAVSLPVAIIGYSAVRLQLDLLVLFMAASLALLQYVFLRYFLRGLATDRPDPD